MKLRYAGDAEDFLVLLGVQASQLISVAEFFLRIIIRDLAFGFCRSSSSSHRCLLIAAVGDCVQREVGRGCSASAVTQKAADWVSMLRVKGRNFHWYFQ